jgi:hypothetical protein
MYKFEEVYYFIFYMGMGILVIIILYNFDYSCGDTGNEDLDYSDEDEENVRTILHLPI